MHASPSPSESENPVVGIELAEAGTRISALAEISGGIRTATRRSRMPPSPEEAAEQIVGLVAELTANTELRAVGLGIAVNGRVDAATGVIHTLRYATGWEEVALADRVAATMRIPVSLDTATNAAALAEAHRGAGGGYSHVLYVLPAQSVTSAYIVSGCVVRGASGMEGQIAHLQVRESGPRCSCGATGHLEPLASAQAIVRNMIGRASESDESIAAMLRTSAGRAEAMSAAQVARLAAEGEPAASAVLADALDALASALVCALALLDPDVIVLGGPLAMAGSWYFEQLRTRVRDKRQPFAPPPLVAGTLEPRAILLGALEVAASGRVAANNGAPSGERGIIPEV